MTVAEGHTLPRGHLVIALVKLLVGLLAEGAEVSALEVGGGGGRGNKAGLEDIHDGGVKQARGADIPPWIGAVSRATPGAGFAGVGLARPHPAGRLASDRAFLALP